MGIYTLLHLRNLDKLVKVRGGLVDTSLKCFVTGLRWLKSVNSLSSAVPNTFYASRNTIHLPYEHMYVCVSYTTVLHSRIS